MIWVMSMVLAFFNKDIHLILFSFSLKSLQTSVPSSDNANYAK